MFIFCDTAVCASARGITCLYICFICPALCVLHLITTDGLITLCASLAAGFLLVIAGLPAWRPRHLLEFRCISQRSPYCTLDCPEWCWIPMSKKVLATDFDLHPYHQDSMSQSSSFISTYTRSALACHTLHSWCQPCPIIWYTLVHHQLHDSDGVCVCLCWPLRTCHHVLALLYFAWINH